MCIYTIVVLSTVCSHVALHGTTI